MLKYLDTNIFPKINSIQINPKDLELIFKSKPPGSEFFKLSKTSSLYNSVLNNFPQQFHDFINNFCIIGIQSVDSRFNNYLHTDIPNRLYAINYVLLNGGDTVYTTSFDSANQNMQVYNVPINTWYLLSTYSLYKVTGITGIRTEISINIPVENSTAFVDWLNYVSFSV